MRITTIGLDIAKNVFQLHGVDEKGQLLLRKRLRRSQVKELFAKLQPCVIGIESTRGAHYWARILKGFGHSSSDYTSVRQAVFTISEERPQ
jgi:transposase